MNEVWELISVVGLPLAVAILLLWRLGDFHVEVKEQCEGLKQQVEFIQRRPESPRPTQAPVRSGRTPLQKSQGRTIKMCEHCGHQNIQIGSCETCGGPVYYARGAMSIE